MKTLHKIEKEQTLSFFMQLGFRYLYQLGYRRFNPTGFPTYYDLGISDGERWRWVNNVDVEYWGKSVPLDIIDELPPLSLDWITHDRT